MTLTTIAIIILVLILIGALPGVGPVQSYGPSGGVGLLLVVLIVLIAFDVIKI